MSDLSPAPLFSRRRRPPPPLSPPPQSEDSLAAAVEGPSAAADGKPGDATDGSTKPADVAPDTAAEQSAPSAQPARTNGAAGRTDKPKSLLRTATAPAISSDGKAAVPKTRSAASRLSMLEARGVSSNRPSTPLTPQQRVEKLSLILSPLAVPLSQTGAAVPPTASQVGAVPSDSARAAEVDALPPATRKKLLATAELDIRNAEVEIKSLVAAMDAVPLEMARLRGILESAKGERAQLEPRESPAGCAPTTGDGEAATDTDAAGIDSALTDVGDIARMHSLKAVEAMQELGGDRASEMFDLWKELVEISVDPVEKDLAEVQEAIRVMESEGTDVRRAAEDALETDVLKRCLEDARAARDAVALEAEAATSVLVANLQEVADKLTGLAEKCASRGLSDAEAAVKELDEASDQASKRVEQLRVKLAQSLAEREQLKQGWAKQREELRDEWRGQANQAAEVREEIVRLRAQLDERHSGEWQKQLNDALATAVASVEAEVRREGERRIAKHRARVEAWLKRMREDAEAQFRSAVADAESTLSAEVTDAISVAETRISANARRARLLEEQIAFVEEQLAALRDAEEAAARTERERADTLQQQLVSLKQAVYDRWSRAGTSAVHRIAVLKESLASAPPSPRLADIFRRKLTQLRALKEVGAARERVDALAARVRAAERLLVGRAAPEDVSLVTEAGFAVPDGSDERRREQQRVALARQVRDARVEEEEADAALRAAEERAHALAETHFGEGRLPPAEAARLGLHTAQLGGAKRARRRATLAIGAPHTPGRTAQRAEEAVDASRVAGSSPARPTSAAQGGPHGNGTNGDGTPRTSRGRTRSPRGQAPRAHSHRAAFVERGAAPPTVRTGRAAAGEPAPELRAAPAGGPRGRSVSRSRSPSASAARRRLLQRMRAERSVAEAAGDEGTVAGRADAEGQVVAGTDADEHRDA